MFKRFSDEDRLIFIIGMVFFIMILDFMMVMPLGPDFAAALGIATHNIGIVGGAYTLAAGVMGFVAAIFLDRFDRKKTILFTLAGLTIATLLGAFVWDMNSMVAARILAGCFGGPLASSCLAMVTDTVPENRRGAAMGKVMGAFAVASVLGVPFGLELAKLFDWRAPFIALSLIASVMFYIGKKKLPEKTNIIQKQSLKASTKTLLKHFSKRLALISYSFMALTMFTGFMIIPNVAAHVQLNMDYPRDDLGLLYLFGGAASFFTMRFFGKMIDRTSATFVSFIVSAIFIFSVLAGFVFYHDTLPVLLLFVLFMVASSARNICGQTLSSKVPEPSERGGYSSVQSSVVHLAQTAGAFFSSKILIENADGTLGGVKELGIIAVAVSCLIPFMLYIVEKSIKRRGKNTFIVPEAS